MRWSGRVLLGIVSVAVCSLFSDVARAADPFVVDPIADTALLGSGVALDYITSDILSSGEIRPQQIRSGFTTDSLLAIDRIAVRQQIDPDASARSNHGLRLASAYAVVDTLLDIFRVGPWASLADFVMYGETVELTTAVTNLTKIAVRRPRPSAYIARDAYLAAGGDPRTYNNANTDSSLSFFSGHSSNVASLAAAATYIAFQRSPNTARPWLTLGLGTMLTTFVGWERVRAGAHFPTDVITGAVVGAGIGTLVVHFHRRDVARARSFLVGMNPVPNGGMVALSGYF